MLYIKQYGITDSFKNLKRGGANKVEIKKGHTSFIEFLNRELSVLSLIHWYERVGDGYGFHCIGKTEKIERRFLFFKWHSKRTVTVVNITAEPGSPIQALNFSCLKIHVHDFAVLSAFKKIAKKFENEFKLKAEIVY